MNVPENASYFTASTLRTANSMIDQGFLGIESIRLDAWWQQFIGDEEKYFAACLLERLIFRSRRQVDSALRAVFRGNLNGAVTGKQWDGTLVSNLRLRDDPKIRLVPVIRDHDPPTKSGPYILRQLARTLRVEQGWMCWPWQVEQHLRESATETIIFVDDFLGTGSQFEKFYKRWQLEKLLSSGIDLHYVPIVACSTGIEYLKKQFANLSITPAELLDDSHRFFQSQYWDEKTRGSIDATQAKNWYLDFCAKNSIGPRKGKNALGFGELELTFGFYHSTPNNSLPILWFQSDNWKPLLRR
ncbi:phosphoribosyltransferase-like protein [Congregibacter litoralis]|uniref:PRTase-CE domain-containing protein n=1 Tax=Congregibacter litoralis KT71 TaxID=314285 RepID=A4ACV7_9GAMM|nr:hypothetical protein [Congregibacter litoralis]EAQ96148.2 hypothetical protein KT71_18821 [Congregibacter litoralis KT71]